jgi:FlaG/FlaF family flagellin (archaellin)
MSDETVSMSVLIRILTEQVGEQKASDILAQTKSAQADLGQENEKLSQSTIKLSEHSREQYRLFGELNRIVPGLGEALRGLSELGINPVIATLGLVAVGFMEAKKAIGEWNAEMDAAGEAAAKSDFTDGIQARITVLNSAVVAAQAYADKEHQILTDETDIAGALRQTIAMTAALAAARGQQAEAEHALNLAKIAESEGAGTISKAQAIEQNAAENQRYEKEQFDNKQKEEAAKLQAEKDALAKAEAIQPISEQAVAEANLSASEQRSKFNDAKTIADKYKNPEDVAKVMEPLTKAADEAAKILEGFQGKLADAKFREDAASVEMYTGYVSQAQATSDQANAAVRNQQQIIARNIAASSPEVDAHIRMVEAVAKHTEERSLANADEIARLKTAIPAEQATQTATAPAQAAAEAARQAAIGAKQTTELTSQGRVDIAKYQRAAQEDNSAEMLAALKDLYAASYGHIEVTKALKVDNAKLWEAIRELQSQHTIGQR